MAQATNIPQQQSSVKPHSHIFSYIFIPLIFLAGIGIGYQLQNFIPEKSMPTSETVTQTAPSTVPEPNTSPTPTPRSLIAPSGITM